MASDKTAAAKSPKVAKAPGTPSYGPAYKIRKYLGEVATELRKTTWPTRPELIAQTQVVLGVLILITLFVALWDFVLGQIFRGLMALMGVRH